MEFKSSNVYPKENQPVASGEATKPVRCRKVPRHDPRGETAGWDRGLGLAGLGYSDVTISLALIVLILIAIVRFSASIDHCVSSWEFVNYMRTSIRMIVVGSSSDAGVFIIVTTAARCVDDYITGPSLLIVISVVVIVIASRDCFGAVTDREASDQRSGAVAGLRGCRHSGPGNSRNAGAGNDRKGKT